MTAVMAFWRDLSFKTAAVSAAYFFLLGDAIGHVRQTVIAGNFAPGNQVFRSTWTPFAQFWPLLFL